MNLDRGEALLESLAALGVRAICLAPGGRNSPLVSALEASEGFETFTFFEERSAGFFGLGLARARAAPVAVITTSGTAAAELLPAAVEGYYAGVPLVLVTADRPERLRGTGAPQAIEQPGLFCNFAPTMTLQSCRSDPEAFRVDRPIHVNVPFDEPLLDRAPTPRRYEVKARRPRDGFEGDLEDLEAFLASAESPIVLLGTLSAAEVAPVRAFLRKLGAPVHAEAPSRLREDPDLEPLLVRGGDRSLAKWLPFAALRIGGVPTLRLWRDLEGLEVPVFSVAATPFRGLSRGRLVHGSLPDVFEQFDPPRTGRAIENLLRADRAEVRRVEQNLAREPRSEPALVRALSSKLPHDARVFVGNSLPIREWDLFADTTPNERVVFASRGANGIDGQLSTFLGLSDPAVENWAMVGDLTALYDLSAPWILPQLDGRRIRFVIINNGGGRIFGRMFESPIFQNEHTLSFESWARMWNLPYERWERIPDRLPDAEQCVVEITPDPEATARFWSSYDTIGSPS